METAAQLETVENELHVFHRSHCAWKTRQKTAEFLQFPQPLLLDIVMKRKEERLHDGLIRIE